MIDYLVFFITQILTKDKHNDKDNNDEQDSNWTCNKTMFWDIIIDNGTT